MRCTLDVYGLSPLDFDYADVAGPPGGLGFNTGDIETLLSKNGDIGSKGVKSLVVPT